MSLQNPDFKPIVSLILAEEYERALVAFSSTPGNQFSFQQQLFRRWTWPAWQLGLLGECEAPVSGRLPSTPPLHVGEFAAYRIRLPLTAVCLTAGIALTVLSLPRIAPGSVENQLLTAAGYLALILGILLRIWSILHIQSQKTISLVMSGPYALSRNPLYLGTLLIIIGYLLMVQSLTLLCCCLPVIALYVWGVVPAEEKVLFHCHGESYLNFCRQVPRWFPPWERFRWELLSGTKLSWSSAVRREVECGGWWILVGLLVHLICSYRLADWWPHPLLWP